MKIKRIHFVALRNKEHFQCQTEFKKLVEEFGAEALKILPLFNNHYLPLYQQEDEAILKIMKSPYTAARMELDRQRDSIIHGMVITNKGALSHFEPEVVSAAKHLKILFDTYGNIERMPLQEESSAIYNLLQELNGDYLKDVQAIGLEKWRDKLQQNNIAYQALLKEYDEENITKTKLKAKEVRKDIDKVFRQIIVWLEALMLTEGETNYSEFVRRLNIRLEHYGDILAQRKGRNAAKKEEE